MKIWKRSYSLSTCSLRDYTIYTSFTTSGMNFALARLCWLHQNTLFRRIIPTPGLTSTTYAKNKLIWLLYVFIFAGEMLKRNVWMVLNKHIFVKYIWKASQVFISLCSYPQKLKLHRKQARWRPEGQVTSLGRISYKRRICSVFPSLLMSSLSAPADSSQHSLLYTDTHKPFTHPHEFIVRPRLASKQHSQVKQRICLVLWGQFCGGVQTLGTIYLKLHLR